MAKAFANTEIYNLMCGELINLYVHHRACTYYIKDLSSCLCDNSTCMHMHYNVPYFLIRHILLISAYLLLSA